MLRLRPNAGAFTGASHAHGFVRVVVIVFFVQSLLLGILLVIILDLLQFGYKLTLFQLLLVLRRL